MAGLQNEHRPSTRRFVLPMTAPQLRSKSSRGIIMTKTQTITYPTSQQNVNSTAKSSRAYSYNTSLPSPRLPSIVSNKVLGEKFPCASAGRLNSLPQGCAPLLERKTAFHPPTRKSRCPSLATRHKSSLEALPQVIKSKTNCTPPSLFSHILFSMELRSSRAHSVFTAFLPNLYCSLTI
jgi:hypothetical protein